MHIDNLVVDHSGHVYVGGKLDSCKNVAMWDGGSWSRLGAATMPIPCPSDIWAMCVGRDGEVYVGGVYYDSVHTGYNDTYVAKWNGTAWQEVGTGAGALRPHSGVYTLCADTAGQVYAAGEFVTSAGMGYVARWGATVTGMQDVEPEAVASVFPNPATDRLTLKIEAGMKLNDVPYRLMDIMGRVVRSGVAAGELTVIGLENLPSGVYTLQVLGNKPCSFMVVRMDD